MIKHTYYGTDDVRGVLPFTKLHRLVRIEQEVMCRLCKWESTSNDCQYCSDCHDNILMTLPCET